jgi:hypothetical protein
MTNCATSPTNYAAGPAKKVTDCATSPTNYSAGPAKKVTDCATSPTNYAAGPAKKVTDCATSPTNWQLTGCVLPTCDTTPEITRVFIFYTYAYLRVGGGQNMADFPKNELSNYSWTGNLILCQLSVGISSQRQLACSALYIEPIAASTRSVYEVSIHGAKYID